MNLNICKQTNNNNNNNKQLGKQRAQDGMSTLTKVSIRNVQHNPTERARRKNGALSNFGNNGDYKTKDKRNCT